MELFDIEGGKIVLDPNVLYIPEFKALWDRDTSEGHDIATKEIAYVTYMASFSSKNPYNAYNKNDKERRIRKDTINREPDELVITALNRYTEMQSTPLTRLLEGAEMAVDVLADYFRSVTKSDATEAMKNIRELGNSVKSLYLLKKQVQKEQLESKEVRGGNEIGMYELPEENEDE